MDGHIAERDLAHELEAGHDHPADPEVDDLARRAVHVVGIEGAKVFGVVRPAEGCERPQRRREPGIEHVGILGELAVSTHRAFIGTLDRNRAVAVRTVVDRHAMAEPQLAADVPVAQTVKPVEIGALVTLRVPADLAILAGGQRLVAHLVHAQPPLLADQRFDDRVAPVAVTDLVCVRLFLDDEPLRLQIADHLRPRLQHRQAVIRKARDVHAPIRVHAVDDLEVMPLADLIVHRVVAGRDLERAGAEVFLDRIVGDDRQLPSHQGQRRRLADDRSKAGIGWVHRHPRVSKHRLGTNGRDHHLAAALDRVADEVERVVVLLPLHLEVRDGGLVARAPVDDPRCAVDPSTVVEGDEGGHHRPHVPLVHGEAQSRPVQRHAQDAVLPDDRVADLGVPLGDARLECLTAQLLLGHPFGSELLLDDVLGGDGGVVHARQEQHLIAGHAPIARADVLERVVERVAQVKLAGDVRRRKADRVLLLRALRIGHEQAGLLPARVPPGLDGPGVIRGLHVGDGLGFAHKDVFGLRVGIGAPAWNVA